MGTPAPFGQGCFTLRFCFSFLLVGFMESVKPFFCKILICKANLCASQNSWVSSFLFVFWCCSSISFPPPLVLIASCVRLWNVNCAYGRRGCWSSHENISCLRTSFLKWCLIKLNHWFLRLCCWGFSMVCLLNIWKCFWVLVLMRAHHPTQCCWWWFF